MIPFLFALLSLVSRSKGTKDGLEIKVTAIENLDVIVSGFSDCYVTMFIPSLDTCDLALRLTTPAFLFGHRGNYGRYTVSEQTNKVVMKNKNLNIQVLPANLSSQYHLFYPRVRYPCYAMFVIFPEARKSDATIREYLELYGQGAHTDTNTRATFYYNIVTTWNPSKMEGTFFLYALKNGLYSYGLSHYVESSQNGNRTGFQIVETRLAIFIHVHNFDKLKPLFPLPIFIEHVPISQYNLKQEIVNFYQRTGKSRNFYFLKSGRGPSNFSGKLSELYFLNLSLPTLNPFNGHTDVRQVVSVVRLLCFELIHFLAYEPIQEELFESELKNMRENYIRTAGMEIGNYEMAVTGTSEIKFTTSKGIRTFLDFGLYVRVYDLDSWLLILFTGFVLVPVAILFQILFTSTSTAYSGIEIFTKLLMEAYGTLLEVGPDNPPLLLKIRLVSKFKYRIIMALWLLMCIVLTNAYKGLVVSDLMAPKPLVGTYLEFKDLNGFTLIAPQMLSNNLYLRFEALHLLGQTEPSKNQTCTAGPVQTHFWSAVDQQETCAYPIHSQEAFDANFTTCAANMSADMSIASTIVHKMRRQDPPLPFFSLSKIEIPCTIALFPKELFFIEPDFGMWNGVEYRQTLEPTFKLATALEKGGIIDNAENVNSFNAFAETSKMKQSKEHKSVNFMQGTEYKFRENIGIAIWDFCYSMKLYNRIQLLLATGIYNVWDEWIQIFHPTPQDQIVLVHSRTKASYDITPKSLNLEGNVITGFYIFAIGLTFVLLIFIAENHESIVQLLTTLKKNCSRIVSYIHKFMREIGDWILWDMHPLAHTTDRNGRY